MALAVSSFCSGAEGSGGLMEVSPAGLLALLEGLRAAAALEGAQAAAPVGAFVFTCAPSMLC